MISTPDGNKEETIRNQTNPTSTQTYLYEIYSVGGEKGSKLQISRILCFFCNFFLHVFGGLLTNLLVLVGRFDGVEGRDAT